MSDEHALNIIEHLENIEVGVALTDNCIRFIGREVQAAIQAERERCAKIADHSKSTFDDSDDSMGFTRNALQRVADAIRRGEGV